MKNADEPVLVLALYPTPRGLGYALMEGPRHLVDWGYAQIRWHRKAKTLQKLRSLIDLYQPKLLILEDTYHGAFRRSHRLKALILSLTESAVHWGVAVRHYNLDHTLEVFRQRSKQARAKAIAEAFPELKSSIPPKRLAWEKEHPAMQVFEAATLALTYFYHEE